jgi:hypothetical protein
MKTVLTLALAMFMAGGQYAAGQASTRGFSFGGYFNGSALSLEHSSNTDNGGGFGLRAAYGITHQFEAFADLQVASMDDGEETYALSHFDLGGRFNFGTVNTRVRPFAELALNGRAFAYDTPGGILGMRGGGISFGGGSRYFFSPRVAFDGGLRLTRGQFTEGQYGNSNWQSLGGNSFKGSSTRLNLGVSIFL